MEKASSARQTPGPQIQLSFSGFGTRLFGYVIDSIFLTLIGLILALSAGILWSLDNITVLSIAWWVVGLVSPFYHICFWALLGATPGKIMLGMRIVGPDGSIEGIGWWRAVVRFLGCILSSSVFYLGYIWIAIDREKQAWHDKIAGTRVIDL